MKPTAVILNDTRGDAHFGCARVMASVENGLLQRGVNILATSHVRNDWLRDGPFLAAMDKSDLIVVNGEGTLHHGTKYGERLLCVATHPARQGKKAILINALYQENPPHWGNYLRHFDLRVARDHASQREMEKACSLPVLVCPDLSLSEGRIEPPAIAQARQLITIGDSVQKNKRAALGKLRRVIPDVCSISIRSQLKSPKNYKFATLRSLRTLYAWTYDRWATLADPSLIIPTSQDEFLKWLYKSRLHVTGRFHGVCLCLATETPFLALRSNTRKIETLLDFFGLGYNRLMSPEEIEDTLKSGCDLSFSDAEMQKIRAGLQMAKDKAKWVFDTVVMSLK